MLRRRLLSKTDGFAQEMLGKLTKMAGSTSQTVSRSLSNTKVCAAMSRRLCISTSPYSSALSSGFQVPPAELEALLLSHDEIAGKS